MNLRCSSAKFDGSACSLPLEVPPAKNMNLWFLPKMFKTKINGHL